MRVLLFTLAVAATYCGDSQEAFGIDRTDCEAIHTEYMAMLKSGKTIEALSADLKDQEGDDFNGEDQQFDNQSQDNQWGDEQTENQDQDLSAHHDDSAPDADMSCAHSCHCGGNYGSCNACNSCMHIRRSNSYCGCRKRNTCHKSYTYGGYVKSHVLIQCYGMIDEGCRRLPTYHSGCYRSCGGCSDSCGDASCGCATHCQTSNSACGCKTCAQNFRRYLHCVGRRVSRCYRTKIIHTREVCHSRPTTWGGCTYRWCVPCDQCTTNDHACHNSCGYCGSPHQLLI